jgi:hypothetical protein
MFIRTLHYIYMYAGIRGQIPKISLIYGKIIASLFDQIY